MRVGIFTNAYRPIISGVVNSVDLIRKGLLSQGHTPFLFAPRFPGFREQHAGVYRVSSVSLSRQVQFPLPCPWTPCLEAHLRKLKLDVLHTHHPFLLGRTALGRGLPVVFTFHTQYEQYAHYVPLPQALVRWGARHFVTEYARRCNLIICPSPVLYELLQRTYRLPTRLEVLPNAIDLSAFEGVDGSSIRRELGFTEGEVVALYAGRMGLEKNLSFLLRAFARVRNPLARLVIVGDGPVLSDLRREAQGLAVTFTGRIPYSAMPRYYAAADFFAMSSTTEVKPLVVLEAMASGLPVVAVAACGTEDTITHGRDGLLSACAQDEFMAILEQAFEMADMRSRMSAEAARTARSFSIEPYTKRLVELYGSLK